MDRGSQATSARPFQAGVCQLPPSQACSPKANARLTGKADSSDKAHADYAEKFKELIEAYSAGSKHIEDLLEFIRALREEEKRSVRENLTEEELVIFDILTRPAPELSTGERC